MPLAEQLSATVNHVRGAVPAPIFAAIAQSISDLQATGMAERAAGIGTRLALPSLADVQGRTVDLADRLAQGPLVLTFYRGGWCPYCNVALRALQGRLDEIRALGADLVAVTPELPDRADATGEHVEAAFPILHDPHNAFARALGLVFALPQSLRPHYERLGIDLPDYNGDATFTLPIPATHVIGRDGVVAWAFRDADFTRRAEPDDILTALRALPAH